MGIDSQRTTLSAASVWLGVVCGHHLLDPHHHPLLHDPVQCPATPHLCPLAPDGREGWGGGGKGGIEKWNEGKVFLELVCLQ